MEDLKTFIASRQKVNLIIVIMNFAVYLILHLFGDTNSASFMLKHGAVFAPAVLQHGEYYRLFTSIFLHFTAQHIFYNMLLLLYMGDTLEKLVGKIRYLIIYLGGGILANIISLWIEIHSEGYRLSMGNSAVVSAGASGAIFAVLGALVWIAIKNKGKVDNYSIKRLLVMVVLSVADGMSTVGIDNAAHVGGFCSGFLLAMLLCCIGQLQDKNI